MDGPSSASRTEQALSYTGALDLPLAVLSKGAREIAIEGHYVSSK